MAHETCRHGKGLAFTPRCFIEAACVSSFSGKLQPVLELLAFNPRRLFASSWLSPMTRCRANDVTNWVCIFVVRHLSVRSAKVVSRSNSKCRSPMSKMAGHRLDTLCTVGKLDSAHGFLREPRYRSGIILMKYPRHPLEVYSGKRRVKEWPEDTVYENKDLPKDTAAKDMRT